MTCCTSAISFNYAGETEADASVADFSRDLGNGTSQLDFAVPDAHCAACIRTIERGLGGVPQVLSARVNLGKRRVRVTYDPAQGPASDLTKAIENAGYRTYPVDSAAESDSDPVLGELLRSLGVAAFGAGNIMLFSVSIWSGADSATRDLFHWISAAIAIPAIAYAGRVFFRSAWRAVRAGHTNMDVPISIGVVLATVLSLHETIVSGEHAYFDASATLLFFLLAGRTLDHLMRERARDAIANLAKLQPRGAMCIREDGTLEYLPVAEIAPGMRLQLKAGERAPVDAALVTVPASFDYSIVSGESRPRLLTKGDEVIAGAINLDGPVEIVAKRVSDDSFLARMASLMDAAESAKTKSRRIADRAAAVYAPVVHALALTTFVGWVLATGDWHTALVNAIAVLIITCPCALALAVPIVHVVAAGRLFERGILMKDGAALERLAEIDSVAFDKTGTLTVGRPRVVEAWIAPGVEASQVAAALAAMSSHPLAKALTAHFGTASEALVKNVAETAGAGISASYAGATWKLGSSAWCGVPEQTGDRTVVCLSADGVLKGRFSFDDEIRSDAARVVAELKRKRLPVRILSGDTAAASASMADRLGIPAATGAMTPQDKVANVQAGRTLMVGDGINDAPAMRAAHVAMAPASAADIGRSASDFVMTGEVLAAVPFAISIARRAARLVNQNLVLAIGYNAIAVPLAVSGHVTPLVAAVAMSSSSILVVANALRLRASARGRKTAPGVVTVREVTA